MPYSRNRGLNLTLFNQAEDVVVVSFSDAGTADAAEFAKTADSMRETVNFAHSKLGALGGEKP